MSDFFDQLKLRIKTGGMHVKLTTINVVVFLFTPMLLNIADQLFQLNGLNEMVQGWLSFSPYLLTTLLKPWSILSNMFVHHDFWHLFMNMLIFWYMGSLLERYLGSRKVLSTYILGGLSGIALYTIAHQIFPLYTNNPIPFSVIGASGAIMAITVSIAFFAPTIDVMLFGVFRIQLIYIALFMILMDLLSLGANDSTAHFVHLGGAIYGAYFISSYKKGKDISRWFDSFVEGIIRIFSKKPKFKVVKSPKASKPPRDDHYYNEAKNAKQAKLDAILDKIKEGGYDKLSSSEKDFLANF